MWLITEWEHSDWFTQFCVVKSGVNGSGRTAPSIETKFGVNEVMILRGFVATVKPPVPWVEDQHITGLPCFSIILRNAIQFQNLPYWVVGHVYKKCISWEYQRNVLFLHNTTWIVCYFTINLQQLSCCITSPSSYHIFLFLQSF